MSSPALATVARDPAAFAGAIHWVSPPEALAASDRSLATWPPLLWVRGRDEPGAAELARLAATLARRGLRLTTIVVDDDHTVRSAAALTTALEGARAFLAARTPLPCGSR